MGGVTMNEFLEQLLIHGAMYTACVIAAAVLGWFTGKNVYLFGWDGLNIGNLFVIAFLAVVGGVGVYSLVTRLEILAPHTPWLVASGIGFATICGFSLYTLRLSFKHHKRMDEEVRRHRKKWGHINGI